jgi:metallophosphoesterase (TIGR03767 family)
MRDRVASRRRIAALATLAALAAGATVARATHLGGNTTGHTTAEQTICGGDFAEVIATCGDPDAPGAGFKSLQLNSEGDDYVVREDIAQAQDGRDGRRESLAYFGQITDFQLADEESPAREERTDSEPFRQPLGSSGFRPQETMTAHMVELSVRQMNNFLESPITQGDGSRARLQNAVMTGDLADNMQLNETQWVLDLLEGTDPDDPSQKLNPGSGTSDFTGTVCEGLEPSQVPDGENPQNYTGVQDYDDYINDNPLFWDPERPLGAYADPDGSGPEVGFPIYQGLLDQAQKPFEAEGLKVPSYVAFGNHDALYQGTVNYSSVLGPGTQVPPFERVATDCLKLVYPFSDQESFPSMVTPEFLQQLLETDPDKVMQVPPDPDRQAVNHMQFKDVFKAGNQADDHGFAYVDEDELLASSRDDDPETGYAAYYSFRPDPQRPVRFVVLDTLADAGLLVSPNEEGDFVGGDEGNIDDPQWQWLQEELDEAEQANELVVAFGHHATGSLTVSAPDEVAPCTVDDEHGHDVNPTCDEDPRSSFPTHLGGELRQLFIDHPNVVGYVAGHSHQNQIQPCGVGGACPEGAPGFWEIKSPAVADWPPQHRVLDLMDNGDGTLSIFTTNLDHEGSTDIPDSGSDASEFDVETLGSIGRAVEYNDPHVGPAESEIGHDVDRNTELLIADPRTDSGGPGSGGPGSSPGGGAGAGAGVARAAPSNAFELLKLKRNKKKGIAFLIANVPGPGEIGLRGKRVRNVGFGAAARTARAVQGGRLKLKITPGKGKRAKKVWRRLKRKGKAKVKVRVTYAPTGGSASTKVRKVKLIRKR